MGKNGLRDSGERYMAKQVLVPILLGVLGMVSMPLAQGVVTAPSGDHIVQIRAQADMLEAHLALAGDQTRQIVELRVYQDFESDGDYPVVWEGDAAEASIVSIPRFDGERDRLYSKFQLLDAESGQALGYTRYVTDVDAIVERDFEIPWPESKKGLTCITDIDDAIETGTRYGDEGVLLNEIIDWDNSDPEMT